MKIPLEWLTEYIDINKPAKEIAASFTQLGLLLDKPIEIYENGDYKTEVLDLEHRMDRSDWLSILGCARDLAAFEKLSLKQPELYEEEIPLALDKEKVEVIIEDKEFVNRFYTRIFKNIKVQESPLWLKSRLQSYGMPSINNIVDITNYVMLEYGQPMHAHDLDKMQKKEIVFRKATGKEKVKTLLGEEITLTNDITITSCNNIPTGVAGIVGGTETAIDANTKNIVLDSGNYNQTMVRKTSRALKIHNETVARTDKFLHPKNNELAVKRATKLILELAGGEVYENGDYYPNKRTTQKMDIREQRIQKLSGMTIDLVEAAESLKRLGYSVVEQDNTKLVVEWPHFRTDIEVEDDIVADILRMYNYMNIPISMINEAPPTDITPELVRFENTLVNILLTLGLDEHITDSLVKQDATQSQVKLLSVLTEDKNALRSNLVGSLEKVAFNYKKHKHREIGLFEVGKVFLEPKTEKSIVTVYYENTDLGIYDSSNKLKSLFSGLMHKLDIKTYELCALAKTPINEKVSIRIQGAEVGELTPNSFTLDTAILMKFKNKNSQVTTEISNNIIENVSILLPSTLAFGPILSDLKTKTDGVQDIIVLEEHILDQNLGQKTILLSVLYATQNPDLAAKTRENLFNNLAANKALKIRN